MWWQRCSRGIQFHMNLTPLCFEEWRFWEMFWALFTWTDEDIFLLTVAFGKFCFLCFFWWLTDRIGLSLDCPATEVRIVMAWILRSIFGPLEFEFWKLYCGDHRWGRTITFWTYSVLLGLVTTDLKNGVDGGVAPRWWVGWSDTLNKAVMFVGYVLGYILVVL